MPSLIGLSQRRILVRGPKLLMSSNLWGQDWLFSPKYPKEHGKTIPGVRGPSPQPSCARQCYPGSDNNAFLCRRICQKWYQLYSRGVLLKHGVSDTLDISKCSGVNPYSRVRGGAHSGVMAPSSHTHVHSLNVKG